MTIGSNTKTFFIVTSRTGQPPIDLSFSLSGWSPICSIRGVFMHAEYTERTWALGNPIICQRPDEIVVLCLLWIQHWTWSLSNHRNYRLDHPLIILMRKTFLKTLASEGGGGLSRRALSCCCSSLSGKEINLYLFHFVIDFILFSCLFNYLFLVATAPTCLGYDQW